MKTNRFALTTIARHARMTASLRLIRRARVRGAVDARRRHRFGRWTRAFHRDAAATPTTLATFSLKPNAKFVQCMAQYPDDPSRQPQIDVAVLRGSQNDVLALQGRYIKPNLQFDMFTIQNDPFNADGTANASFTNFGFAWYQSDLEANDRGVMKASIRTILLDQIFGFDPAAPLAPDQHIRRRLLVQRPERRSGVRLRRDQAHPVQRRAQGWPAAAISAARRDHRPRTAVHEPGYLGQPGALQSVIARRRLASRSGGRDARADARAVIDPGRRRRLYSFTCFARSRSRYRGRRSCWDPSSRRHSGSPKWARHRVRESRRRCRRAPRPHSTCP